MIFNIICNEIKYHVKNVNFYMFGFVLVLMFLSQLGIPSAKDLTLDSIKDNFVKTQKMTDNNKKIEKMYYYLGSDYDTGTVRKEIFTFYHSVKLNNYQRKCIKNAIDKIYTFDSDNNLHVNVTYAEYNKILKNLDNDLGNNTIYASPESYGVYNEDITTENAEKIYNEVIKEDKFTNAYGRLFADYMGITAGFFPVFLSVFIFLREKRNKLYNNFKDKISFEKYMICRFIGICICIMICYLILASVATFMYTYYAVNTNIKIDFLGIYKYTIFWILPTVMFVVAGGMLLYSVLKNVFVAVVVQLVLWMSTIMPLSGNYNLIHFVIRFNIFGQYNSYILWKNSIIQNRIFYTIISFIIVLLSTHIFKMQVEE